MKKHIFCLVLTGILLISVLGACTPNNQPATTPDTSAAPVTPTPVTPTPGATPTVPPVPANGATGSIVIADEAEPPVIAPARHASLHASYQNSLNFNSLFRLNYSDLRPVPDLVESYRAINDTTWEFTIFEGIRFHNGEEMTAYDVVASLLYVKNYPDAAAFQLSVVDAEVVDRYTLTIYTGTPNAMLFSDLLHQTHSIMPKSLIESGHDFLVQPIGSGPFVFETWNVGDSLVHTAFDDYFNPERAARIRELTWRIIPEGASRTIALEMGEIDYIVQVAAADIPRMQEHPDIDLFFGTGTQHNAILLNNDLPKFQDVRVRRAIDMAIDKEAVLLVGLEGFGTVVYNQVPINFVGVSHEGENRFDPEGAKALLAETGIDPSTLDFSLIASNDARVRMGEIIQANLAELGITVSIERMDLAAFMSATTEGRYETAIANFTASNLLTFFNGMLHSRSIDGANRARINVPEIDALIDQAVVTIDEAARIAIYGEITRLANENTGTIPLFQAMVVRAFSSNLAVPETSATGALNVNMMYWRN